MSAKWRALQHRHRYTYSAVIFPTHIIEAINQTPSTHFSKQLIHLTTLTSTYSQLNHTKNIASSFIDLLSNENSDQNSISIAAKSYLEILFLENSVPLHKTLVSALVKAKNFQQLIGQSFLELCLEYGGENGKGKRFCVSRVALSMMSTPKLGHLVQIVEQCAVLIGLDVVSGLNSVISETNEWSRPSPILIEQCQEALSCIYYLLQRYPTKFDVNTNTRVMNQILTTILNILKSEAFSRDCLVAAGVSWCAALQVCLSSEDLGIFIIEGVFMFNQTSIKLDEVIKRIPYNGDLIHEIHNFSPLNRLSLIRGILTSIPRDVMNNHYTLSDNSVKSILYDGILLELINYCENPIDSHFNFHSLTVLQICLQQIKTSIQSDFNHTISENTCTRILNTVWKNLEDPLSQTVKQVHLIFDLFITLYSNKTFLTSIASDLLKLGPRCKGRYAPLSSLTKRLTAKTILDMNPNLLFETTKAYIDDDVCCALTSFLKCFLENLRDEYSNSEGYENGYIIYRGLVLPPVLHGLASGIAKLRTNLNTYALPILLDLDMDSIFPMLGFLNLDTEIIYELKLSMDVSIEQKVAILVSLLKVARVLCLIEGDIDWYDDSELYAFVCIKGIKVKIPVKWLVMSLTHSDESLRVDAAETLFINPKMASLPSLLELNLMKKAVPLNMRCSSTAFQMKWTSLFKKFFSRVKIALERQFKQEKWVPRAEELFNFMKWLTCFMFFSCYPSAPYERKKMAMKFILTILNVWPMVKDEKDEKDLNMYSEGLTQPDSTMLLVGSIVDSWDILRESSFQILLHFPTPLPGLTNSTMVNKLIIWAMNLVCSPRVRESDAGALTLRLIFRKYVLDLGTLVKLNPTSNLIEFSNTETKHNCFVLQYINSLIEWLKLAVQEGEKDLQNGCKNSSIHGVLLTLRYTFEELDWNSQDVLYNNNQMKLIMENLLKLIMRITSMALWVVSSDALHLSHDDDDVDDVIDDVIDKPSELSERSEQIVMVGCWLAMKEVSLLLGTVIRKVPLPSSDEIKTEEILDISQLQIIGDHFLEVLLKMKHSGAIDKTRAGFTALCNRLLSSNDPRLCKLTESWMEQLMERMIMKGQTVDDLLRRSAGIPAAFSALFLSEPEGTPKKLLPKALKWLINVAQGQKSTDVDFCVVPIVHAFNVLRTTFNDTNLSIDTSGFSGEALIIAIKSFSSSYWEVRNSACLAYTSLIRRMVGFLNVQKRASARRALSGLEFFHRYPLLHPFLLEELKVATDLLTNKKVGPTVHPSLCPILIFLARLRPSEIATDKGDILDPFLFTPFIKQCSIQKDLKIRILSSRALTGLISNEKLHVIIIEIASELSELPGPTESYPFNSIHGMLLQLITLLETNCKNLPDISKKDEILYDLGKIMRLCSWIGKPRKCACPIINTCFLKVLDSMVNISSKNSKGFDLILKLLMELSYECLDIKSFNERTFYDPTITELREQAVTSYLNCVYQVFDEMPMSDFTEKLLSFMSDTSYEVRIVALKWVLRTNFENETFWEKIEVQDTLKKLLLVEKNKKCVYYILKILYHWNSINYRKPKKAKFIGNMDFNLVIEFWDKLVSFYEVTKHAKTKQILICCMGICMKRFSSSINHIDYYINVIEEHSDSVGPVNMRKAASESIIASGLLEKNDEKTLNLWSCCIKLLEDEDEGIRTKLALDIQNILEPSELPSQVEKVIEMSFNHLSGTFRGYIGYFNYLCETILTSVNYVVTEGDLVRRVFDKEIDNHHEEKLLIVQICCFHIEKIEVSKNWDFLSNWMRKFYEQLVMFVNEYENKQGRVNWVGGLGNYKDTFLPVYANLLAYYALLNCLLNSENEEENKKEMKMILNQVGEIKEVIRPFFGNPQVGNLYRLVVKKLNERFEGLNVKLFEDCYVWDEFNPYFLLE